MSATRRVLEVRCCCIPKKLLGWMSLPVYVNRYITVAMRMADGGCEHRNLPIETIRLEDGRQYKAIKAEGMTIEELRRIPGFRENYDE